MRCPGLRRPGAGVVDSEHGHPRANHGPHRTLRDGPRPRDPYARDQLPRRRRSAHRAHPAHAGAHQRRRRRPLRGRPRRRRCRRRPRRRRRRPRRPAAVSRRAVHDQGIDRDGGDAQLRRPRVAQPRLQHGERADRPAHDRRGRDPARRHEHARAVPLDRDREPPVRPHEQRLQRQAHGRWLVGRRGRGRRLGRLAARARRRHRRLDPHPRLLQRRLWPEAVARDRAEHRPVSHRRDRDRRADAHDRADRAPCRGSMADAQGPRRPRRDRPVHARRHARRPGRREHRRAEGPLERGRARTSTSAASCAPRGCAPPRRSSRPARSSRPSR